MLTVPSAPFELNARHQCSVEYKIAKKNAEKLTTKSARAAAKKDAKRDYKACVDRAKSLK